MIVPLWLTLLLGFLTAVGPVSTDMYLPAFPLLDVELGGGRGSAQITLAAWFAGLAVGQITQGTLSDRYGRRTPLLFGTLLYAVASAGCALAPDLLSFSTGRVLAAFGGSASMVVPRAMVRDLADGHQAARLLSRLMLVMSVVPILAPALGGALLAVASWRDIFWAAAAYGLLGTALVWFYLPDTLPPGRRLKLGLGGIVSRYLGIARERSFVTHAAIGGLGLGALFCYLAGSPSVFIIQYHVTPTQYGMLFGLFAAGFILVSQFNARAHVAFGASRVLSAAVLVFAAGAVGLAATAWTGFGGLLGIVVPLLFTQSSLGLMMPTSTVGALSRHAGHAASASALMGTGQFLVGALTGAVVGLLDDGTARPMASIMLLCALAALAVDRARRRVLRQPAPETRA